MTGERNDEMNRLDAALRAVGSAEPDAGMEGRILTRVAAARMESPAARLRFGGMPRFVAPLAGFVSAGVVCGVIVVGSVRHSHEHRRGVPVPPPVLQIEGAGVGAASAVHPANPGTAVPASPTARGRATHRTAQRTGQRGRARIAPHAKKAPGVAVPGPSGSPEQ